MSTRTNEELSAGAQDVLATEALRAVLSYSEWLDVNGLMKTPRQSKDTRTHDELARDFFAGKGRRPL